MKTGLGRERTSVVAGSARAAVKAVSPPPALAAPGLRASFAVFGDLGGPLSAAAPAAIRQDVGQTATRPRWSVRRCLVHANRRRRPLYNFSIGRPSRKTCMHLKPTTRWATDNPLVCRLRWQAQ
ncbi:hypothetical protein MRX96_051877 [Rhipicephalus microplus]